MEITSTSGLSRSEAIQLSKKLIGELVMRDRYDIIDSNKRDEILREQGFQQSGACDATSCLVEAGKLLGAEKIIGGCIGKIGAVFSVELQMVDVRSGKVERVFSEQVTGRPELLLESMRKSSFTFTDAQPKETAGMVPQQPRSDLDIGIYPAAKDTLVDLNLGLVAHYRLDNDAMDASRNRNNGTVFGTTPTTDRHGRPEGAMFFDGKDDYILIQDNQSLDIQNALTISAWVRPAACPQAEDGTPIVAKGYGAGGEVFCFDVSWYSHTALRYLFWVSGRHRSVVKYDWLTPEKVDKWVHVVGIYDGALKSAWIYEDGQRIAQQGNMPGRLDTNDHSLSIGSRSSGKNSSYDLNFHGSLDDIRIYDRTLNESEITALFEEKP